MTKIWPNGKWSYLWQQLSAVYLLLFFPSFIWMIWPVLMGQSVQTTQPSLLLVSSVIALGLILFHSWIGLRDILMDYCPARHLPRALKLYTGLFSLLILNMLSILLILLFR
jgi:succinate dehydrogenase / fumarate reductase membrane anchor subunit